MTPPTLHAAGTVLSKVQIHAVLHRLAVSWGLPSVLMSRQMRNNGSCRARTCGWWTGQSVSEPLELAHIIPPPPPQPPHQNTWPVLRAADNMQIFTFLRPCVPSALLQTGVSAAAIAQSKPPFSGFATKPAGEQKFSAPVQARWSRGV